MATPTLKRMEKWQEFSSYTATVMETGATDEQTKGAKPRAQKQAQTDMPTRSFTRCKSNSRRKEPFRQTLPERGIDGVFPSPRQYMTPLWGARLSRSSHFRDEGLGLRTVTRKTVPMPPPPPLRSPRAWTGRTSVFSSAETLTFIVTSNSQFSFPGQGRTS